MLLDEALEFIAQTCNGDMRSALNKLELAFNTGIDIGSNSVNITIDTIIECSSSKILSYDRGGDVTEPSSITSSKDCCCFLFSA